MKKFCANCNKKVEPVLENFNSQFELNNKVYKYRAYRGYCPECNSIIEKVPNQDLESREKAFRKAEGIITTNQINDILDKYDVTSEQLSSYLGWENEKINNYILGDMPSRQDSEMLVEILDYGFNNEIEL